MRQLVRLVPALAFATLAACGPGVNAGDDDDDVGPDARTDGGGGPDADEGAGECRKMDIVFVIDDSLSMAAEQENLRANFPQFAQLLNSYTISTGETLDYRAAVTTTGIDATITYHPPGLFPITETQRGPDGQFLQRCGMTRPWLERTDPDMVNTFTCLADVGTNGASYEMPLRASQLAATSTTNPGFLRDDALLAIVILTDEDDCSRTQSTFTTPNDNCSTNGDTNVQMPTEIVAALDTIKGDRGRWAAAVIAGQTTCESTFGAAEEGIRLKQFQQQAGTNVVFGDICGGNLAPVLQQALETFQAACENFPPIGRTAPPLASDLDRR